PFLWSFAAISAVSPNGEPPTKSPSDRPRSSSVARSSDMCASPDNSHPHPTDHGGAMTLSQLEREVRVLKMYSAISTVLIVFALLMGHGRAQSSKPRFAEIDAERINIVEADGRLSLVLANTQRLPGPMLAGKELAKELS